MKTDCYEQLEKILVKNPFRQEVDQWKKDLQDFHDGRKQMQDLRFILKSDCENFNKFQNGFARKNKTRDTFLHPEVLPQPFIGTPCAPVWYLLLNPGYSFLDRYDHLGILPNQEKYEISAGSNSAELLSKRQELLIEQLCLKADTPFHILDNSFNTLSNARGSRKKGGFRWWKANLFGVNRSNGFLFPECGANATADSMSRNLFVIECCPYHSQNFDKRILWEDSEYQIFWKSLIEWAICSGKRFIVRSRNVFNVLKANGLQVNGENSVGFSNERNVAMTIRNLGEGNQVVLEEIFNALKSVNN